MVFSGDLLKETYSKFKPEYTCWFDKSTWTSTKYFAFKYK